MSSPIDPMRVLKDRVAEVLSPLGLELRQFITVVSDDSSGDTVQVVFTINEDLVGKTQEQVAFDTAFEDIARSFQIQTSDDKEAEARANLEKLLKHNKPQEGN
jgi:hypothetical protein